MTHPATLPYRTELQGLRALAVILVFASHAGVPIISGGFIGVDVFYVLSGYLISGLLLKEHEQSRTISVIGFYGRRLRRLLPALMAMIIIGFCAAVCLLSRFEAINLLASAPYAATWTSNIYFTYSSTDYFNEFSSRDLYLHTWSLGVEEQFYLIWPALLAFLLKRKRPERWPHIDDYRFCRLALCSILIVSFGLSVYLTYTSPKAGFYLMPSRIWQFAAGALIHFNTWPRSGVSGSINTSPIMILPRLMGGAGVLMILGSGLVLGTNVPYPGWRAIIPSLGAVLVIASVHRTSPKKGLLSHPMLVWLGDRSYSLYLWHWPVLILGFSYGLKGQPGAMAGLIGLTLVLAALSYRYVELPFWKGRFSHGRTSQVFSGSLCVTGIALLIVLSGLLRSESAEDLRYRVSVQSRSDIPVIYTMGCDSWYTSDHVTPCVFGNKNADKTVVVLGDSILAQWFSAFPAIFPGSAWRVVVLTKSACPMVDKEIFYQRIGANYTVCSTWRNRVLDELDRLRPDVVIVGSNAAYEYEPQEWIEGSRRVLARISRSASRVHVIVGTPSLAFDGPECLARNIDDRGQVPNGACLSAGRFARVDAVKDFIVAAASQFSNVNIADFNDLICPEKTCRALSPDGQVIFRDSKHLTDSFVRSRIREIKQRIGI